MTDGVVRPCGVPFARWWSVPVQLGLVCCFALALLAGCGDSSEAGGDAATAETVNISVNFVDDGVDDASRRQVARGTRVVLDVTSDVADEVHVHGYDLLAMVGPGETARFDFISDRSGVWEVELEDLGRTLFELQVDR